MDPYLGLFERRFGAQEINSFSFVADCVGGERDTSPVLQDCTLMGRTLVMGRREERARWRAMAKELMVPWTPSVPWIKGQPVRFIGAMPSGRSEARDVILSRDKRRRYSAASSSPPRVLARARIATSRGERFRSRDPRAEEASKSGLTLAEEDLP